MMNMPPIGSPFKLALDCRQSGKIYSCLRTSPSVAGDGELEEYVKGLEEERLKIEGFKRELPLCMQLINDVIEASDLQQANHEKIKCEEANGLKPSLKEFIPVNTTCEEPEAKKSKVSASYAEDDMSNWMCSAKLWSHSNENRQITFQQRDLDLRQALPLNPAKNLMDPKNRAGGAFLPFSRERQENHKCLPHLDGSKKKTDEGISRSEDTDGADLNSNPEFTTSLSDLQSAQRKARRCWSPELHKKFVNALQQLGGAHATPKQIREVMKVDGLTNDEVKSHLQKYRLHTRRHSPSGPQSCVATQQSPGSQFVVVGSIWVPPPSTGLYTALPNQLHGHYYCQPPPPPTTEMDNFCSQGNTLSSLEEQFQRAPKSPGITVGAKSKFPAWEEEREQGYP